MNTPARLQAQERTTAKINAEILSYTINDASSVSGLSRSTIYRLAADGRLRLIKIGARRLVEAASLRTLIGVT